MVGLIVDFTWCIFRFDGYAVVYLLFIVTPVVCVSFCFMHAFFMQYVVPFRVLQLSYCLEKRGLVALLL